MKKGSFFLNWTSRLVVGESVDWVLVFFNVTGANCHCPCAAPNKGTAALTEQHCQCWQTWTTPAEYSLLSQSIEVHRSWLNYFLKLSVMQVIHSLQFADSIDLNNWNQKRLCASWQINIVFVSYSFHSSTVGEASWLRPLDTQGFLPRLLFLLVQGIRAKRMLSDFFIQPPFFQLSFKDCMFSMIGDFRSNPQCSVTINFGAFQLVKMWKWKS